MWGALRPVAADEVAPGEEHVRTERRPATTVDRVSPYFGIALVVVGAVAKREAETTRIVSFVRSF